MNEPKLTFWPIGNKAPRVVPEDRINLIIDKGNTRRIVFNMAITEKLKEGGYNYLKVGSPDFAPEVWFIFCKEPAQDTMVADFNGKKLEINSKYIVEKMVSELDLKMEPQLLKVSENLSNKPDYMTFRVTRK